MVADPKKGAQSGLGFAKDAPVVSFLYFSIALSIFLIISNLLYFLNTTYELQLIMFYFLVFNSIVLAISQRNKGRIIFLVAIIVSICMSYLFDISYDGMHYHLPATLEISNGRNILFEEGDLLWSNIYPSGVWRLASPLVEIPFLATPAAFFNTFFAIFSGIIIKVYVKRIQNPLNAETRILICAIAFSPVVVGQLASGMIDGLLCSLFVILSILIFLNIENNLKSWFGIVSLIGVSVLLSSTKTAGIAYMLLAFSVAMIYLFIFDSSKILRIAFISAVAISVSIIANIRPIVTNIEIFGSPIPDYQSILATHVPDWLSDSGRIEKLAASVFGVTSGTGLKIPGHFTLAELRRADAGPANGGFGPFFSVVFLFSLAIFIYYVRRIKSGPATSLALIGCGMVTFFIAFPEPWAARFVAPLAPAVLLLSLSVTPNAPRLAIALVATTAVLNSGVFAANLMSSQVALFQRFFEFKAKAESTLIYNTRPSDFYHNAAVVHVLRAKGFDNTGTSCDVQHGFDGIQICFDLRRDQDESR